MHITYDTLREFTAKAFSRSGLSAEDAATGAEVLAMTDAWGVYTHGTKLLRGYLRRLKAGGLRAKERPTLAAEGLAWALVDGNSSLGLVTSVFAMQAAILKRGSAALPTPGCETVVTSGRRAITPGWRRGRG